MVARRAMLSVPRAPRARTMSSPSPTLCEAVSTAEPPTRNPEPLQLPVESRCSTATTRSSNAAASGAPLVIVQPSSDVHRRPVTVHGWSQAQGHLVDGLRLVLALAAELKHP